MTCIDDKSGIYWNTVKHFKPEEFLSPDSSELLLDRELVYTLDLMREALGRPIIINSGYRTESHNFLVGGKSDSAHLTGKAVDIKCLADATRWELVKIAINYGVSRIGLAKAFIHIDVDKQKPQGVFWIYES